MPFNIIITSDTNYVSFDLTELIYKQLLKLIQLEREKNGVKVVVVKKNCQENIKQKTKKQKLK